MQIVVHGGRAHADDFLGACVCLYKLNFPVFRRAFSEEMLENPDCWVLDQGRRHEPQLHNFDHHQLNQEICAFTMVLDYFYGENYRILMPNLRFIEIFDSQGPAKAAEFAGTTQDSLDITVSPIHVSFLKSFSSIEGVVEGSMLEIMRMMGKEICTQIENSELLFGILEKGSTFFESFGLKVLDTTKCVMPEGYNHDQLPTKIWCKSKKIDPAIVLTMDTRTKGAYRMVSINTESVRFQPNSKSHFTHASGFLTSFMKYDDYPDIIQNHVLRS